VGERLGRATCCKSVILTTSYLQVMGLRRPTDEYTNVCRYSCKSCIVCHMRVVSLLTFDGVLLGSSDYVSPPVGHRNAPKHQCCRGLVAGRRTRHISCYFKEFECDPAWWYYSSIAFEADAKF
jgi:hypothetical protein